MIYIVGYDVKVDLKHGGEWMAKRISEQQLEVMDALKQGAKIQAYRSGTDLRAFISHFKKGHYAESIRITTLFALCDKGVIFREKANYGDDWAGIWALTKGDIK